MTPGLALSVVSIPASDIRAACILGLAFLALLAIAEAWSRLGNGKPEWTRKLVHVCGGLACLLFPFVMTSPWTVLLFAASITVILVAGAETRWLQSLHRVKRRSRGSEYFPISVFLVFILSQERPWLYVASMLVLTVADAFAALIGMRYGKIRYEVEEETKSLEGSLAFGMIAFAAIAIPLVTMTDLPLSVCLLSALLVAAVVTGFEAVCLTGTDNLFVPIGVCVILSKITTKPLNEIIYQNASMALMLAVIVWLSWRARALNIGGALTLALFAYGAWSLGSEWWAVPALTGFAVYIAACVLKPLNEALRVRTVFRAVTIPLALLVAANMLNLKQALYAPFVASLTVVLFLSIRNHLLAPGEEAERAPSTDEVWPAGHMIWTAAGAAVVYAAQTLLSPGLTAW